MKILLTDKEIDKLSEEWLDADEDVDWAEMMCKAQLKKVYEWLISPCEHELGWCHKFSCPLCRDVLLKEVEDGR